MIDAIGIIVPAHDEEAMIGRCLASLERARAFLPARIATHVVVVLDACVDGSQRQAARVLRPTDQLIPVDFRSVGKARAHGAQHVLRHFAAHDPARVWLVTTDADSHVSQRWLADHRAVADTGAHALAGAIRIDDWQGYTATQISAFRRWYRRGGSGQTHNHVHGANLGVRADAYLEVGGFDGITTGEDHALWSALQRSGKHTVSRRAVVVTTSSRRRGRAPHGFANFMVEHCRRIS